MRCGLGWGNILQPLESISETLKHFANHITQLYEQGADEDRIGEYVWHGISDLEQV